MRSLFHVALLGHLEQKWQAADSESLDKLDPTHRQWRIGRSEVSKFFGYFGSPIEVSVVKSSTKSTPVADFWVQIYSKNA